MPSAIPLAAVPSQNLSVTLGNQSCQLRVYQLTYGLFVDLYINNVLVIGGVIAENLNRIVRNIYLGFIGDLAFYDMQGTDDPSYLGLGSRFQLLYFSPAEL